MKVMVILKNSTFLTDFDEIKVENIYSSLSLTVLSQSEGRISILRHYLIVNHFSLGCTIAHQCNTQCSVFPWLVISELIQCNVFPWL